MSNQEDVKRAMVEYLLSGLFTPEQVVRHVTSVTTVEFGPEVDDDD